MLKKWIDQLFGQRNADARIEIERYKSHVYHHFNRPDYYEYLDKKMAAAPELPADQKILWQNSVLPDYSHWTDLTNQPGSKRIKQFSSLMGKGHKIDLFTFDPVEKDAFPAMMDLHKMKGEVFWARILYPRNTDIYRVEWITTLAKELSLKTPQELYKHRFRQPDGTLIMYEDARNITVHLKTKGPEITKEPEIRP